MADPKEDKPISKEAKAERAETVDTGDFSPIETTGPLPPPKLSLAEMRDGAVRAAMPPEEGPPTPPAEPTIVRPAGEFPEAGEGDAVRVPISVLTEAGATPGAEYVFDRQEGEFAVLVPAAKGLPGLPPAPAE